MGGQATPVLNHGAENLDNGMDLGEASQHDVFMNMANEMLGIEPEEIEEETVDEVSEETEEAEDTEETETEDEIEEESDEEEEVSDEEEAAETDEDEPESEVFLVQVDGKEEEITVDELRDGYLRNKDYTHKTQEIAAERTKIKEYTERLEEERTKYTHALEQLIEADKAGLDEYNQVDWEALKQEDPNKFLMLQYEMNEKRAALQSKIDNRNKAYEQSTAEKDIKEKEYHEAQNTRAKEIVEGWQGENHEALVQGLKQQTEVLGFDDSDQELLKHAMVIKLLQKAKAFDDYKASQEKVVEKKIKRKVPKAIKAGKSSTGKGDGADTKHFNKSMERLRKTGDIKDSVGAFEAFL